MSPASVSFLLLLACADKGDTGAADGLPANVGEIVDTYAAIVSASYGDAVAAAGSLDGAIQSFVAAPSAEGLEAARQAWLDAREPYLQTEVFRFYDGPIDDPEDGPEGLVNAWPMDENYIDYVTDDDSAGIVNDPSVAIDAETLEGLNEQGGETNIATGFHAIEFLLWGQDLSETGPGDRPWEDYLTDGGATAANGDRRGLYLTTVSQMLVGHLSAVQSEWGQGAYAVSFVEDDFAAAEKILTGMIVLAGFETGGERLQAALDSGSQEDEHSCFSDNTHRDMIQDIQGVSNVWSGAYGAVSGPGVAALVAEVDPALADEVAAQIDAAMAAANALQPPFDSEIDPANAEGNARVAALIDELRALEDLLFEVFTLLGMSVELPD